MRRFHRKPTPEALTCQELVELVTDYLEGTCPRPIWRGSTPTSAPAREACVTYIEQIRASVKVVGTLAEETAAGRGRRAAGGVPELEARVGLAW